MMNQCVASVKAGVLDGQESQPKSDLYVEDGVAFIEMNGPMMKAPSKFGGCSTVYVRQLVREAMASDEVKKVMMIVESGGGSVSGTKELADDVRALNEKKPVTAYINDIGASAAYWVASQASNVVCNEMAEVGSIGVVAVVEDTSEAYERAGVKVHVISTGDMKGAFTDGAPVTDAMIEEMQAKVDFYSVMFKDAILSARDIPDLDSIADGRTYTAQQALKFGLVDGVARLEDVVAQLKQSIVLDARKKSVNLRLSQSAKR
jgi:signal peptide peptidase SppA